VRSSPVSRSRAGSTRDRPPHHHADDVEYGASLAQSGFRFTRQRRVVYDALASTEDHPTAVQVFMRVKDVMPNISLATVYNCLETLSKCGLIRQVYVEREASRFCANQVDHGHFYCTSCGRVDDVMMPSKANVIKLWQLPAHYQITQSEVSLRGICSDCATKTSRKTAAH
jgi:Fur family peroxide stress response transcriptional regulator